MSENNKNKPMSREELKEIVKKRKKKKIIIVAFIIVAVIVAAALVGLLIWQIARVKPIKRTDEQAQVVGKVGDYDIYYDEFSYLVSIHKADIEDKYGKVNWDGNSDFANKCREYVMEDVLEDIEKNYLVLTLCEQNGIDINSREINREVNERIKAVIKDSFGGKKSEYKDWLEEHGLSDAYYRLVWKVNLLEEDLLYKLVEDGDYIEYSIRNMPDFVEYAKESDDFMCTTHVYYPKWYTAYDRDENGNLVTYRENVAEKTSELARDAALELSKIEDAKDRYNAINEYIGNCAYYVEDITMANTDAVYFTRGLMGDEYESAVAGLETYGTSDVVETEDGYYVIMRLPKDESYIDRYAEDLLNKYQVAKLLLLENQLAKALEFKCDDIAALISGELTK